MGYTRGQVIMTSSSSGTGTPQFVGDARLLTLSIATSNASASRYTISLSNDDGFQSAITNWSIATTLLNAGIYVIDAGARWMRTEQPDFALSATSAVTMTLNRMIQR